MKTSPLFHWLTITLREAAWAPLTVVGVYVFGLAFHLFGAYPWMDMPTHFLGGVTITYFFRVATRNAQTPLGPIPPVIQTLLAFTATGTTTVFWEFYENLADHFLGTHMVRGLEDTIVDLFMGVTGGLLLSLFYRRH